MVPGPGYQDLARVVRARRMVRAFTPEPVDAPLVDELLDLARRAPSAGNTASLEFLVLDTPDEVARYWNTTLPAERRDGFAWPGLVNAPVLVLPAVRPVAYIDRYGEPDKLPTGLGAGPDAWAVPYWWVDGGMAVEHLLLGATAAGLGACFFGVFTHEPAVRDAFGVPPDRRLVGAIALGHPAPPPEQRPGRSASRPRPALDTVVHRARWRP